MRHKRRIFRRQLAKVSLIATALAPVAEAQAPRDPLPVGPGTISAQVVGATLAIPVGFVAAGLTTRAVARALGASPDVASLAARVGAFSGAALLDAGVVTAIGSRGRAGGSFPAAIAGTVAGGLGSYLLIRLNKRAHRGMRRCGAECIASALTVAVLPATGATLAFNATRRRE